MLRLEEQFAAQRPAVVVVQGDTNTAVGGALAANALDIPLVHVEAGLRSFDRRMPEEHNRVVVDHLADLCLALTEQARDNLLAENIPEDRIAVTGNTVVDVASRLIPTPEERADLLRGLGLVAANFVLATFHRPEKVDDIDRLGTLLEHLAPVIVVRRSTERPEVLGTFATLVPSLADLPSVAEKLLACLDDTRRRLAAIPSPCGNGEASARCVRHITLALANRAMTPQPARLAPA